MAEPLGYAEKTGSERKDRYSDPGAGAGPTCGVSGTTPAEKGNDIVSEPKAPEPRLSIWERLALLAAGLTLVGSLYLSMGMGLNACPLCFYQRTFIMAVVGVLGVGTALRLSVAPGTLSLLALPLALSGLGVAAVHSSLVWSGVLACPKGVLGLGFAPEQSLAAYMVVTALLLPGAASRGVTCLGTVPRLASLAALAGVLVTFSVLSSPKLPPYNPKYDAVGNRIVIACERAKP